MDRWVLQTMHPYLQDPGAFTIAISKAWTAPELMVDKSMPYQPKTILTFGTYCLEQNPTQGGQWREGRYWLDFSLVFGHCPVKPLHPENYHDWRDYPGTNSQLTQKLQNHQVRAYFCGHDHTYDRKDNLEGCGFDQIIVGNAGADSHCAYNFMVVDVVSSEEVKYIAYLMDIGHLAKQSITKHYSRSGP